MVLGEKMGKPVFPHVMFGPGSRQSVSHVRVSSFKPLFSDSAGPQDTSQPSQTPERLCRGSPP